MTSINSFPHYLLFSVICILVRQCLYVPYRHFFVKKGAVPRTLKMQNKAKLKTAEIPVTHFTKSNNKKDIWSPQPKNKPKQSQNNVAQASSLSEMPPFCRCDSQISSEHPVILSAAKSGSIDGRSKVNPVNPACPPKPWRRRIKNEKMTNEPNFFFTKIALSPYWIAGCWKPKAGSSQKTNPIQTKNVERSEIPNLLRETQFRPSHASAPP